MDTKERTLVLIKPDGVARGLCGEIIRRFERRDLKIIGLKLMHLRREQAERHYAEHQGKSFFPGLVDYITSGPLVAIVLEGRHCIRMVRNMVGLTNPLDALPGTIRGDYAYDGQANIVHASDGPESAAAEIAHLFTNDELHSGEE